MPPAWPYRSQLMWQPITVHDEAARLGNSLESAYVDEIFRIDIRSMAPVPVNNAFDTSQVMCSTAVANLPVSGFGGQSLESSVQQACRNDTDIGADIPF
jgi:hypothetical protein